jgi:D-3-phosphoglycerate dehydrogenase
MTLRVLVTEQIHPRGLELLRSEAEVVSPAEGQTADSLIGDVDGIIVRLFPVGPQVMQSAPRLKVIGRHGTGVDNVDLDFATRRGIPVVYTPDANAASVAEYVLALMLAVARNLHLADRYVRDGEFHRRGELTGTELRKKTLGIVGLGRVGRRVADICAKGLGMSVLAYDPYVPQSSGDDGVEIVSDLESLLAASDFVSVSALLTEETRGLIGRSHLAMMKPTAYLVNTARGAVVDEASLAEAVRNGQLAGAALDVFSEEPPPLDSPALASSKIILSPHIASNTGEALERMSVQVVEAVLTVLRGERVEYVANPEVWDCRRVEGQ